MRNPKEFDRVAQEWAVKYAGAPKKERGENSGGASAETIKQRQKKSKEQEEAERVAQYVSAVLYTDALLTCWSADMGAIMRT